MCGRGNLSDHFFVSPVSRYGWQLQGRVKSLPHPAHPSEKKVLILVLEPHPYFSYVQLSLQDSFINTVPWGRAWASTVENTEGLLKD